MTKPPRELHSLDVLRVEMQAVDKHLANPIDVYLLGGCAMSYLKLKPSTKDLDLVMENEVTLATLKAALEACHYESLPVQTPYDQLDTDALYKKKGAPQWDLYVGKVCASLTLSPGMIKRATTVEPGLAKLRIHACDPNDIFVFKSITEREADLDDLDLLASQGLLNWATILDEMKWQRANSATVWSVKFLQRLEELTERGYSVHILEEVRAMAEEDMERTYGHKLPK